MVPLLLYTHAQWQRSPRTPLTQQLFDGVIYQRQIRDQPWPQVIHKVTVDLTTPGVEVLVSPGSPEAGLWETAAQTTSEYVSRSGVQLAVNASFFSPFKEKTPWHYGPHSGDRANVLGIGIGNGEPYSSPEVTWPAFCVVAAAQVQIGRDGHCPDGTWQAVAGSHQLVADGQPIPIRGSDRPYARVMAAVSNGGKTLTFVVVDGKQPHYSEGATLAQLTQIAIDIGADAALNLDGGGSTTLVINTSDGPQTFNAPIHTKMPMRERPVASHIGIRVPTAQ
ncbi:MAG: phosphodiester glycosidase family protein [Leptolyngbyaceae cyanobacterium]